MSMRTIQRIFPLLAAVLGILLAAGPGTAATKHKKHPSAAVYWGATIDGGAPYTWAPVAKFESAIKKPLSLVGIGAPFASCPSGRCRFWGFPTSAAQAVRQHGAIPFVSYSTIPTDSSYSGFTDREVANGRYDSAIRTWARQAKAWGHPFFLRFDWEMNGDWFGWGTLNHEGHNRPGDFVPMWRHVHKIFREVGVRNATWVWCPNIDPGHFFTPISRLYPGNAYVDWTCLDGYNWGSTGRGSPGAQRGGWTTFGKLYRSTYVQIVHHIAPRKPMILGEVASSTHGGSQGKWIRNMLRALPTSYPNVHGFVWYNVHDEWSFPVNRGGAQAFAAGLRNRYYASNTFCRLRGTIHPPKYPAPRTPFCARG